MKDRKRIQYLIGVIALAVVATGLEGCASPAQRKEQAAKALQEKYKEDFEITALKDASILEDYFTVKAYAVEYPDLLFQASVNLKSGDVMDSYVTKRVCDRLSDQISQNLGTLETDYFVFTEAMLGDTLVSDPEISLENFIKEDPYNTYTIYLFLNQNGADAKNITSALLNMMNGISGIRGSISLFLTDTETLGQVRDYVTTHDDTYGEFDELVENARIGYVDFENGKFSLTEEKLKEMAGDRL